MAFPVIGVGVHPDNQEGFVEWFLLTDCLPNSYGSFSRKKDHFLAESGEQ